MPYITSERVKEIRIEIKKAFPEFKFSVTKEHHSSIHINILEGPINFETRHEQVNHFYIKDLYQGKACEMLMVVKEIANKGNYTVVNDSDYGAVPSFYLNIGIGKWDKPYKWITGNAAVIIKFIKPI